MNICIDGLSLYKLQGTGHYTYCYNFVGNLLEKLPQANCHLLWDESPTFTEWNRFKRLQFYEIKINRIRSDYTPLEKYIKECRIDVFHSPNNGFSIPSNITCPYVMTVHDMIALSDEKYTDGRYCNKFTSVFPRAVINSSKIIAVSQFIKKEIMTYFNIPDKKIEVIYPIININKPVNDDVSVENILKYKYNIQGQFILYVGSLHSRKNLDTLLVIFKDILKQEPDLKLVIAGKIDGKRFDYYQKLLVLDAELGITNSIIFTGFLPHNDLYYLYSKCQCMVNLSGYDGFPMACAEAMSIGVPMVCSNISSIREVIGDASIMVDPQECESVKDSILQIIRDSKIRKTLSENGINRSKALNDINSINKLISLYEEIL